MANPTVTLRLPEPMYAAITAVSTYTGRSAGDLGREAFADWLSNLELDRLKQDMEREIEAKQAGFADMTQAIEAIQVQLESDPDESTRGAGVHNQAEPVAAPQGA